MSRETVYLVEESSFGVPVAAPVIGTNAFFVRLDRGNAFTMRAKPVIARVPYGGGVAIPAFTISGMEMIAGNLSTFLYGSQAAFMLGWAGIRITGGTSPWTTTEPNGDLASCSLYHSIQWDNGTIQRKHYSGVKVGSWSVACSGQSQIATLQLGLQAQKYIGNAFDASADPLVAEFPAPTDAQLPTDVFRFIDSGGNIQIGGVRSKYDSVEISVKNAMDARFFESRFIQLNRFLGRSSTMKIKGLLQSSTDRDNMNALTTQNVVWKLANATHSAQVSFNGQNLIDDVEDDLSIDKVYEQSLTLQNQWDATAGADIGFTFT